MTKHIKHPPTIWALIGLLIVLGLGGIYGGISFIADPTGGAIQIPQSYLQGLPISDYLLPGIFLLTLFGFFPLILAYGLWKKPMWLSFFARDYMAWIATVMLSIGLMAWMFVQAGIIGIQYPIQIIVIVIAVAIFILALLPQTRDYYDNRA